MDALGLQQFLAVEVQRLTQKQPCVRKASTELSNLQLMCSGLKEVKEYLVKQSTVSDPNSI